MKKAVLLTLFFVLITGVAYAGKVKIGMTAPLTGPWASEGQEMKRVVELMTDELNNAGGINGQKVEMIIEDDGGDPKTAALAATRLVTRGVCADIGAYGSSITEVQQAIFNEAEILQIATASTAIRLSEKKLPYFFRTAPRDDEQGRVAAETIKALGYKRLALLHDNSSFAKGLAKEIQGLLKDNIVFFEAITPGEKDFSTVLYKIKNKNPDIIFFTGYYPEAGLLLRQKKEMGLNIPVGGGDGTSNLDLLKIAGKDAANGYWFLSPPTPQDLTSNYAKDFLGKYNEKYKEMPNSIWALLAGDAFKVIATAVEGSKSTDADKLSKYIQNEIKGLECFSGALSFNKKGDRVGDLYRVYQYSPDGKPVVMKK